jgi:small GTP-binding protein
MYLVRVIIVGDTGVGKTSLLVRFHENNFSLTQKTTIGVDYKAKEINIEGEIVKLQIWDTAGQERFRSMTAAFYNRAQVMN